MELDSEDMVWFLFILKSRVFLYCNRFPFSKFEQLGVPSDQNVETEGRLAKMRKIIKRSDCSDSAKSIKTTKKRMTPTRDISVHSFDVIALKD